MKFLFEKDEKFIEYNCILLEFLDFRIYVSEDPDFPKDTIDVIASKVEPVTKMYSCKNLFQKKYFAMLEGTGTLFGFNRKSNNIGDVIAKLFSGNTFYVFESASETKTISIPTFSSPTELRMKLSLVGNLT